MLNDRKQLLILKVFFTLILFFAALNYEGAQKTRTIIYILLFIVYLSLSLYRYFSKNKKLTILTFIMELSIIYIFEYNSRYQVNYIFHLFYFLILLEIPINFNKKQSLIVSIFTIIISNIKFIMLLYLKPSFGDVVNVGIYILE